MVSTPDGARRLHPGTIALRIVVKAPQNAAGIVALGAVASQGGLRVMLGVGALALVAAAVFTWARWRSFTYRIAAGELVIADGILHRNRRSIPFERIQDVSIDQKLLARVFGLARVRIETGGGEADEATLDSVSLAEAGRLRAVLRGGGAPSTEPDAPPPARTTIFAMGTRRVLSAGVLMRDDCAHRDWARLLPGIGMYRAYMRELGVCCAACDGRPSHAACSDYWVMRFARALSIDICGLSRPCASGCTLKG